MGCLHTRIYIFTLTAICSLLAIMICVCVRPTMRATFPVLYAFRRLVLHVLQCAFSVQPRVRRGLQTYKAGGGKCKCNLYTPRIVNTHSSAPVCRQLQIVRGGVNHIDRTSSRFLFLIGNNLTLQAILPYAPACLLYCGAFRLSSTAISRARARKLVPHTVWTTVLTPRSPVSNVGRFRLFWLLLSFKTSWLFICPELAQVGPEVNHCCLYVITTIKKHLQLRQPWSVSAYCISLPKKVHLRLPYIRCRLPVASAPVTSPQTRLY